MNVGELKAQFVGIPDAAILVVHDDRLGGYCPARASLITAVVDDDSYVGHLREATEKDNVVKMVLVFGYE